MVELLMLAGVISAGAEPVSNQLPAVTIKLRFCIGGSKLRTLLNDVCFTLQHLQVQSHIQLVGVL